MKKILVLLCLVAMGYSFNYLFVFDCALWLELDQKSRDMITGLMPWGVFWGLLWGAFKMYGWARSRKSAAFAFGIAVQMFLPDPNVQKTIEVVTEEKKAIKQSEADNRDKN